MGSGIIGVGSGKTALGSGFADRRVGFPSFFRDQESDSTIFVGSRKKIGHAFRTKDQKFAYKNGISDENLIPTLPSPCNRFLSLVEHF